MIILINSVEGQAVQSRFSLESPLFAKTKTMFNGRNTVHSRNMGSSL